VSGLVVRVFLLISRSAASKLSAPDENTQDVTANLEAGLEIFRSVPAELAGEISV